MKCCSFCVTVFTWLWSKVCQGMIEIQFYQSFLRMINVFWIQSVSVLNAVSGLFLHYYMSLTLTGAIYTPQLKTTEFCSSDWNFRIFLICENRLSTTKLLIKASIYISEKSTPGEILQINRKGFVSDFFSQSCRLLVLTRQTVAFIHD